MFWYIPLNSSYRTGSPLIRAITPAGPPRPLGGFSTPPSWSTPNPTRKTIAVAQMITFMLSRIDCIMMFRPRSRAYETGAAPRGRREKRGIVMEDIATSAVPQGGVRRDALSGPETSIWVDAVRKRLHGQASDLRGTRDGSRRLSPAL